MKRLACLLTAAALMAGTAVPAFAGDDGVSRSEARKVVQAYLADHDQASLRVGTATRKDDYYKVPVITAAGIPVASFKVDATTGKILEH